jgi:hypothetical protein
VNGAMTGRMQQLIDLAERAHHRLDGLSPQEKRVVLEALEIHVSVLGWEHCDTCGGKGKVSGGRGGLPCPTCHMVRQSPRLRIEGTWTSALIEQYGDVWAGQNAGPTPRSPVPMSGRTSSRRPSAPPLVARSSWVRPGRAVRRAVRRREPHEAARWGSR